MRWTQEWRKNRDEFVSVNEPVQQNLLRACCTSGAVLGSAQVKCRPRGQSQVADLPQEDLYSMLESRKNLGQGEVRGGVMTCNWGGPVIG